MLVYSRETVHGKSISNEHECTTKTRMIFALSDLFIVSRLTSKQLLVRAALSTWKLTEFSFCYCNNLIRYRRLWELRFGLELVLVLTICLLTLRLPSWNLFLWVSICHCATCGLSVHQAWTENVCLNSMVIFIDQTLM